MSEPTPAQLREIAEALYRASAPARYGNDIRPFEQIDDFSQRRFIDYARIAIEKWETFKQGG